MIFDSHCHLGAENGDAVAEHGRAQAAQVTGMLDVGIDAASTMAARDRARRLDGVRWSAGLHPCAAERWPQERAQLVALMSEPDCAAIGETGLDLFHDPDGLVRQQVAFVDHLQLARQLGAPVVIHSRAAWPATLTVLAGYRDVRGVIHCFAGDVDEARAALDLGLHISFAGPVTYRNAHPLHRAAAFVPADRLLVETDAPWLPPRRQRGRRNEPAWIVETIARVAELRGEAWQDVARYTAANAAALFGGRAATARS